MRNSVTYFALCTNPQLSRWQNVTATLPTNSAWLGVRQCSKRQYVARA
jgi:hypothetical protein